MTDHILPFSRSSNPLIQLGESLAGQLPSDEEINRRCRQLFDQGVDVDDIIAGARELTRAEFSTEILDISGKAIGFMLRECHRHEIAAEVHYMVADMLDTRLDVESLRAAVWHYQRVDTADAIAAARINEANARCMLAGLQVEPDTNLEQASLLCSQARSRTEAGTPESIHVSLVESQVRRLLAEIGLDPQTNLSAALDSAEEVLQRAPFPSSIAAQALIAKANCFQVQAGLALDTALIHQNALSLCENARNCVNMLEEPEQFSRILAVERKSRLELSRIGIDPIVNATNALDLVDEEIELIQGNSNFLGDALNGRAVGHLILAEWSPERTNEQLVLAIQQTQRVAKSTAMPEQEKLIAAINEAKCHLLLAERGHSSLENLTLGLETLAGWSTTDIKSVKNVVLAAVVEASIRRKLAEQGVNPAEHLRTSIEVCTEAESKVVTPMPDSPQRSSFRRELYWSRAGSHLRLADLGIDPIDNLKAAVFLHSECEMKHNLGTDALSLNLQLDAATALRKLALQGVDMEKNLNKARSAIRAVIDVTDGIANPRVIAVRQKAFGQIASAHVAIASTEFSENPANDFLQAVSCIQESLKSAINGSLEQADLFLNEALARVGLARCEHDAQSNAGQAAQLAESAAALCDRGSFRWGRCQMAMAEASTLLGKTSDAVERLSTSLSTLDSTRSQLADEDDRIAFGRTVAWQYSTIIRGCLDLADENRDHASRREWIERAWSYVQKAKARTFLEFLESSGSSATALDAVPSVNHQDTVDSLQRIALDGKDGRTLLIEYYCFDTEQIVTFLVPTWDVAEAEAIRFGVPDKFSTDLCAHILREIESTTPFGDGFQELPENLGAFFQPLQASIDELNPTDLILSPHFYLNLLPLHVARIGEELLIDRWPVCYLPTSAVAGHLHANSQEVGRNALVVGDPTGDLAFTAMEANNVSEMLRSSGVASVAIVGTDATSTAIADHANELAILHLACHGVLEKDYAKSGFELADGRVPLQRIMEEWNLRGTSLAFLSTCVSGLSISGPTDDFLTLARVFFHAGATSAISNLWTASEAVGECFANNLYRQWIVEGQSLAVAFKQATLLTRKQYPEPRHWASFALIGHPDPAKPTPVSQPTL